MHSIWGISMLENHAMCKDREKTWTREWKKYADGGWLNSDGGVIGGEV